MKQTIYKAEVMPSVFAEDNYSGSYDSFMNPIALKAQLIDGMESVLNLMLTSEMTEVPDRKAVFFNCQFFRKGQRIDQVIEKIGNTFPDYEFARKCLHFALEKVMRTIDCSLLCSHQNRDPEDSKWGGSASIVFKLFPSNEKYFYFTMVGAASGLKEWEDLSLFLGCLHYLGFIEFDDEQVQNILDTADTSVAGQSNFLPKGKTIKLYVEDLFLKIDKDLLLVA